MAPVVGGGGWDALDKRLFGRGANDLKTEPVSSQELVYLVHYPGVPVMPTNSIAQVLIYARDVRHFDETLLR